MAEATLPLPAKVHATVARALDWVWPRGAAWAYADAIAHAPGDPELRFLRGNALALNFHPGQPMDRVPRREAPLPRRGPIARLPEGVAQGAPRHRDLGPAPARGGRVTRRGFALGLLLFAAGAAAEERETAAAREQARLCERKNLEEGAAACRQALALGIGPERRGPVRTLLARHLVALERWDDLAELLREDVRADPASARAWQRLGFILLFALGEAAEAIGALQEASRLAPADAESRLGLGLALHATGRPQEAVAALEEALKIEPSVLDGRPGARAVLEALRRGEPWP